MSTNRIQKLLFSEYCDFEDIVLVESPFAETSREGSGIRQVNLGLTPSKLVLATDILPLAKDSSILFIPGLDPEIETLELIAVYPIDCVNLSVFHRRKRQSLKARFCNNKVRYFELGGFEKRNMFWNLWCEKIKFLSPDNSNFSHSETSVATSTSDSTLYLISTRKHPKEGGAQIWCQYAGGDFLRDNIPRWQAKHVFLGGDLDELPSKYAPIQLASSDNFLTKKYATPQDLSVQDQSNCDMQESSSNGLYLPVDNLKNYSHTFICNEKLNSTCFIPVDEISTHMSLDFTELANSTICLWEMQNTSSRLKNFVKHRRRYALAPQPYFYRGLGPWNVNQGERFTLQMKRVASVVCIKRQSIDPELRLSVSRRQLLASISYENLQEDRKFLNKNNTIRNTHKSPIFFWTPGYWYRPQNARAAYRELQAHLQKIYDYHQFKNKSQTKFFRKKTKSSLSLSGSIEYENESNNIYLHGSKEHGNSSSNSQNKEKIGDPTYSENGNVGMYSKETVIQFLKRMLRMEIALSAWDFDSNILATQLTLIDRDLFVRIIPEELSILLWQQSSKNASNIGALIAFSHRISCLVCTEILKDETVKIRARIIARFINVAEKCNSIKNFQSCRSVLSGLQAPPIYRLHATWNYVRKRHSTRYETFETLCRLYRDARLPAFQNAFHRASKSSPYIPFIGDIISKLLDVPFCDLYSNTPSPTTSTKTSNFGLKVSVRRQNLHSKPVESKSTTIKIKHTQSLFKKILSTLKVWHTEEKIHPSQSSGSFTVQTKKGSIRNYKSVADFYKELYFYEDKRQEQLKECMELLVTHQNAAARYTYPQNTLANEYLLKARYKEDQENFIQSFSIEPVEHRGKDL